MRPACDEFNNNNEGEKTTAKAASDAHVPTQRPQRSQAGPGEPRPGGGKGGVWGRSVTGLGLQIELRVVVDGFRRHPIERDKVSLINFAWRWASVQLAPAGNNLHSKRLLLFALPGECVRVLPATPLGITSLALINTTVSGVAVSEAINYLNISTQ